MRKRYLLFLLLAGLTSSCMLGSYPSGYPSSGGQQYPSSSQQSPDDTYPNAGNQPTRSRSADPGVTVNSIRLTKDYTILNLTFINTNPQQRDRNGQPTGQEYIEFDPAGQLVAANGARKFGFLKAEGIPLKSAKPRIASNGQRIPEGITTLPGDKVTFTLYFERLDKGLENFDLFECNDYDQIVCWNIYNLYVNNPADQVVYTPPTTPVPTKPLPTKKPTTLPQHPANRVVRWRRQKQKFLKLSQRLHQPPYSH